MKKGFTLIEILIYVVLFAIVGGLTVAILFSITRVNQRESASGEVSGQFNFVMQQLQQFIGNSSNIDIVAGVSTSTLKLRMRNPASDPTCLSLVNGTIKLAQGPASNPNNCTSTVSNLTSNRIVVNTLNFKKFSQYPGHDTVSVDMTMTFNSSSSESSVQRSFSSAIARVSAATFDSDVVPGGVYNFNLGQAAAPWQKVIVADGWAGDPSYTFGNSTGMGLFRAAADVLGFSTAGSERMRIDASGRVGIGTKEPNEEFDVEGDTTSNTYKFNSAKTYYLSISPLDFRGVTYNSVLAYNAGAYEIALLGSHIIVCPVQLPHGAIVTSVIIKGSDATETWTLYRADLAGTSSAMATAAVGTADTTITNPTIDDSAYTYGITTSVMESGDKVYGALITYTLAEL